MSANQGVRGAVPAATDPRLRRLVAALCDAGFSSGLGCNAQHGDVVELDAAHGTLTYIVRLDAGHWQSQPNGLVADADDIGGVIAWARRTFGDPLKHPSRLPGVDSGMKPEDG